MKDTDLTNCDFETVRSIYNKYFSLGYLNTNITNKLALIAMVCYLTNHVNKGRPHNKITCYDLLCKIGKNHTEYEKDFYKSVGAICEDFMYGCTEFETFGVKPKDMPRKVLEILNTYIPF